MSLDLATSWEASTALGARDREDLVSAQCNVGRCGQCKAEGLVRETSRCPPWAPGRAFGDWLRTLEGFGWKLQVTFGLAYFSHHHPSSRVCPQQPALMISLTCSCPQHRVSMSCSGWQVDMLILWAWEASMAAWPWPSMVRRSSEAFSEVTKLQDAPASVVRSQCTGLCRHFDSSKRLKFRDQAVHFSAALHAKFSWAQTERDQLMKSFADGAADAAMAHSNAPAYWPLVRHIQRCRQEEAARLAQEACQKQLEEKRAAAQRAWDEAQKSNDKADKTEAEALQMGSLASEQMMEVWRTNFKRFFMFLRVSSLCVHCMALRSGSFRHVEPSVDMRRLVLHADCGNPWNPTLIHFKIFQDILRYYFFTILYVSWCIVLYRDGHWWPDGLDFYLLSCSYEPWRTSLERSASAGPCARKVTLHETRLGRRPPKLLVISAKKPSPAERKPRRVGSRTSSASWKRARTLAVGIVSVSSIQWLGDLANEFAMVSSI